MSTVETKLAVLEERMATFTDLFHKHVEDDHIFFEQLRRDVRGLIDWKIKVSVYATIGSAVGGFLSSLLLKWL